MEVDSFTHCISDVAALEVRNFSNVRIIDKCHNVIIQWHVLSNNNNSNSNNSKDNNNNNCILEFVMKK